MSSTEIIKSKINREVLDKRLKLTYKFDTLNDVLGSDIKFEVGDCVNIGDFTYELKNKDNLIENWHKKSVKKTGIINSNISQTLFEDTDNYLTISWDATYKQPTYTVNNWGWHDGSIFKIDGNSSKRRAEADDRSSGNGTFYFTNGGERKNEYDMENYGSYLFATLVKETFESTESFPSVFLQVNTGSIGACSYILNIVY
ncbi:hypothetical protein BPT24_185 [Tenacibaculum phage pT24]|uniref:Uncharacterized protein n=1 Tax=Tenacibaculum phage pT24 TaxID=1880590 RepID=A0A1B4XWX0_9CAUD|nr:hypothetical protein HYP10_gp185 [Tenacibaculum phage pT24]BAV39310.1 hypothetical protein BPT24_185 [Tenacibaculum phage pT24]